MSQPTVCNLTLEYYEEWNNFVLSSDEGTFFHLSQWITVIESIYNFKPYYLYVRRAGEITAVLPLFLTNSFIFGKKYISSPLCVYGGVLSNDITSCELLLDEVTKLGNEQGVKYIELRNTNRIIETWQTNDSFYTFKKKLHTSEDENYHAIPRKQRAMIRKGQQAGLTSEVSSDIDLFYNIYSDSMHRLGTPVYPRKYFYVLANIFQEKCRIMFIRKDSQPISAVLSFYYKNQVLPYYAGGRLDARTFKAYDFMYWNLMCRSVAEGIGIFDFGRSTKGSGTFSFKKNWGFQPQKLFYQYKLIKAKSVPNINPLNPKYKIAIALWKRLPSPIANKIGPIVSGYLG